MKLFVAQRETFNQINEFILIGHTGNPKEFAKKLKIEVATFYIYLRQMRKDLAVYKIRIIFDNIEQTYYYSRPGRATLGWTWIPEE